MGGGSEHPHRRPLGSDFRHASDAAIREGASFLVTHRARITSLAAHNRLPAVYPFRDFFEVGGLLSCGECLYDNFRRAATYADRILKGATPNELPVQAPVKFELVVNTKAVKALGLTIPQSLLLRADQVIE